MAAATESSPAESSFSEEVSKLMGQGKRHLVCSEVLQAVKCFEEATQKLDGQYGSGSDECGEAYLFYGKALLELARTENGVLGNALKDVEPKSGESSDEDEEKMGAVGPKIKEMSPSTKEKIRDDVQNAMAEEEEGDSEDKDKESKDQDTNKEEKQDKDEKAKNETEAESGAKSEDTASTEKTAEDKNNKKGEKGDKEENKDKEEVAEDKERGKEAEDEGKEAADEGKEAKEGGKGAEEGGKEAKEVKEAEGEKEGKEETQEVEEEEGEDEAMEEEEGEDEEEGIADDQGEDDNAEGATAEGQEEEDADVPTMQLAWEFLELARIIFLRQDSKESQLNLGEVYLKLGEIQLEQEQFETAAEEFQKCLDLQVKHLEPDDRLIAETAYNMGLAFSLQPNYTKAKDFFNQALDVIKLRTTKLEARIEEWESKSKGKGKATDDNPCVVDRKELEELQNLYPEIKARVDDAQEMMNSAQSTQPESTTEEGFGSSGQGKSDVPASTIPIKQPATLIPVRRKRKPEEETGSTGAQDPDAAPVKKARQEEDPPAAPDITENGHVPNGGVTSTEQN